MYRSVLAVVDPGAERDPALERAVAEARAGRARLTLLCAVPPPCVLVCFASVCREALHAEALEATARDLRSAIDGVPPDVPVTTVIAPVALRHALRRELARADHDLVVVGAAARRWWQSLGARRFARRCSVPVLRATGRTAREHAGTVAAPLPGAG